MSTTSLILDIMIEVVSSASTGLPAMRCAGNLIAADADFNLRMYDAHGPSGYGTAAGMVEHMRAYQSLVDDTQNAWDTFRREAASDVMRPEIHDTFERALSDVRRKLDEMR